MDDLKNYSGPTFVPGGILEEECETDTTNNDYGAEYGFIPGMLPELLEEAADDTPGFYFDGSGYYDEDGVWHDSSFDED